MRYDCDGFRGVDGGVRAVVGGVTDRVGVVTTTPLIADAAEGTFGAAAFVEPGLVTGMGCQGCGEFVGFPDIHFVAAGAFSC